MAGFGWSTSSAGPGIIVSEDGKTASRPESGGGGVDAGIRGAAGRTKSRRYFELTIEGVTSVGVVDLNADINSGVGSGTETAQWGLNLESGVFSYRDIGGSGSESKGVGIVADGILGVLVDFEKGELTYYKDGATLFVETINLPLNATLYPAITLTDGEEASSIMQSAEPFSYPPIVTYAEWDKSDSLVGSKVSGVVEIEGVAVARIVKAFSYERLTYSINGSMLTESKPLGQTVSDSVNGEYEIILRDGYPGEVFVVAFDDYGIIFKPNASVVVGERIHPTIPNGYVYECNGSGGLPSEEPYLWPISTAISHSIGTASFYAMPFYRPEVHGPIIPVIIIVTDPYFSDVSLLLTFDGENNATTFSDLSENEHSVSAGGNAKISTAHFMFGGSSLKLDGTGDYVSIPYHDSLNLEGVDFTIEGHVQIDEDSGYATLIDFRGSGAYSVSWVVFVNSETRVMSIYDGTINSTFISTSIDAMPEPGIMVHWAIVQISGELTIYIEGAVRATESWIAPSTHTSGIRIGANQASSDGLTGYVDNIRITKGVARYVEDFIPPDQAFPVSSD